ncbi:hypothetical protein RirG_184160 [Rhizophagus irregularis DAOM 197198w]|uniref:Uncharacterized protein n=2 Tax=Rhizophagus irregularis TaxID=588596 RepID=A0A015IRY6_RHIIW|nr:hypothetical protein RirG_184160 [Rhizophagus irregularis DAOM 197198w]
MTESRTHKYFDRKSSEWNITGFLEECEVESLELKIDRYLKSLEDIIKYEQGNRFQRAQTLLDRYREGTRPDRQVARKWEDGRKSDRTIGGSSIYFHNSTITGNAMINNSGTINERNRERDQEKSASEDPKKSKKRQAEETSPVMTPPPNIRNRSPPPSYYSGNNSLNDYEIADATEASPKTNYRNESNVEITRKEDDNPFDARTDEGSTKYKVVLSWRHAINNMVINNWVTRDGHNISIDFRNFQLKSIEKLEMSIVNYVLQPEYVECTEKTWNEALPRSLIPKELPTVADLVIIEYNRLLSDSKSLNTKWRSNWSKGNTFTYLSSVSYNDDKKLDEDTFIHRYCHQILEEIFNKTELSLVWANGESESSKERRLLDGHSHGRKPDFRILSKIDDTEREFIFGEIKPPHCPNTINKSIIKLAEFMKGSLDLLLIFTAMWLAWKRMLIELKPIGSEIKIFSIDLVYDGLYRCNLLSKVLFPTESANFLNILTVVSTLYSLLERARSTINIINSSRLTTESSSPRHSYCRNSNSSPKKIRVPIVRI